MIHRIIVCLTLLTGACSESSTSGPAGKPAEKAASGTPAFEFTLESLKTTASLAPNQTYADNGLGLTSSDGSTFVCAIYVAKNVSAKAKHKELPTLVAEDGTRYEVSMKAAGSTPSEWGKSTHEKIEPGESGRAIHCFEVPTAVASAGLTLSFVDKGWGKKQGWSASLKLR